MNIYDYMEMQTTFNLHKVPMVSRQQLEVVCGTELIEDLINDGVLTEYNDDLFVSDGTNVPFYIGNGVWAYKGYQYEGEEKASLRCLIQPTCYLAGNNSFHIVQLYKVFDKNFIDKLIKDGLITKADKKDFYTSDWSEIDDAYYSEKWWAL